MRRWPLDCGIFMVSVYLLHTIVILPFVGDFILCGSLSILGPALLSACAHFYLLFRMAALHKYLYFMTIIFLNVLLNEIAS